MDATHFWYFNLLPQLIYNLKNQDTLRLLLQIAALFFVLVLPFAEPSWHPKGSDIFLGAVVPAVAPIIFILLMLDSLMCFVWRSENDVEEERQKLTFAARANFTVGFVLISFWIASFQDALFG